jgi:pleiotropic regulator 1
MVQDQIISLLKKVYTFQSVNVSEDTVANTDFRPEITMKKRNNQNQDLKTSSTQPSNITFSRTTEAHETGFNLENDSQRIQHRAKLPPKEGRSQGFKRPLNTTAPIVQASRYAPWKCHRVITGHSGWVRSIAVEPTNQWFCTGSSDRTIKVWDLSTGCLKLTLTGHIEQVTGVSVSKTHPYMFSCGLDKMVKCWDLEYNKVIRSYHGHLSGVYCIAIHPNMDILITGGRDSVCRIWDMRTKVQIHCLSGHQNTVGCVLALSKRPQVITGSSDSTICLWDLRKGEALNTLCFHKKGVKALLSHPQESSFCAASADNIKKIKLPDGSLHQNLPQGHRSIVNCLSINSDNVMVSGGDNGNIWFWDYTTGNCLMQRQSIPQPGSLESEAAVLACSFDTTGSRLMTCQADKSIKMWKTYT